MAKLVTRSEVAKKVSFKVYNPKSDDFDEFTCEISDCLDGMEIVQASKEGMLPVGYVPLKVLSVRRVGVRYKMKLSYYRTHSTKSYFNLDDNTPLEDEELDVKEESDDDTQITAYEQNTMY